MKLHYIETPLGLLEMTAVTDGISSIIFVESRREEAISKDPFLLKAAEELEAYFAGRLEQFSIPLCPQGTPFQKRVWQQLSAIPYGKTRTYGEIAQALGDPKTIRAAAGANGKNPLAIVIPCHRVIGSDGSLTGYAGGLHRKKWLLEHESPVQQTRLF